MSVFKQGLRVLFVNTLVIFFLLQVMGLQYLIECIRSYSLLYGAVVLLAFIVINLGVIVSQRNLYGVNNMYLLLVVILIAFVCSFSLCFSLHKYQQLFTNLKGFTEESSVRVEITPVIKRGQENDRYIACILSDTDYCVSFLSPNLLFYTPYSVCNMSSDLIYKNENTLTKYDFLRKTFFNAFNVQIYCKETKSILVSLTDFRETISKEIKKVIFQPQSSLLSGIIFGIDQAYDEDFARSIKSAGLSHIVAASGYNVTILLNSVDKFFFFLNKKLKDIVSLLFIWLYALLTGFSSSMVRACTMSSLVILGRMSGTKLETKDIFKLTFSLLILLNPFTSFDIGFQLSIAATFGLIYLSPVIERVKLLKSFATTLSCILTTLPITILNFNTLSPYTLFANILVLPVIEIAMILSIVGIVVKPLLYIVWGNLKYVEIVANLIDRLPYSQIEISGNIAIFLCVTLVILIVSLLKLSTNERTNNINNN